MRKLLLWTLAAVLALALFLAAVAKVEDAAAAQGAAQLESAVRQAAVACYAAEGIYPPSLDYLRTHYGLQTDESRYTVIYQAIAENLMPDITVLEREP